MNMPIRSWFPLAFAAFALGACAAPEASTPEEGDDAVQAPEAVSALPGNGRKLLIGQSNISAFEDIKSFAGEPDGGSVYFEVRSNSWNGGDGGIHKQYADYLAGKNKLIQVGVSWKDNPPGWNQQGDNGPAARQATRDIADGRYDGQFSTLTDYIRNHPQSTFLIRIDYEVSSYYHCTDDSCRSYKDAFNHVADLIRRSTSGNARFIFHPVRGEFDKLYPGDQNVDLIGASIFNHELCLPIFNMGQTYYNGTPGNGFDVQKNTCDGYTLVNVGGNANAQRHSFEYDFNILGMLNFAKNHGKRMIVSESAPMNFAAGQNPNGTENDGTVALWMRRLFGLMNYKGALPNAMGNVDLSGVIEAVVYINNDLRYGWDGKKPGATNFEFPYDADWFNNAQVSQYGQAKGEFCNGLAARGFSTRCR